MFMPLLLNLQHFFGMTLLILYEVSDSKSFVEYITTNDNTISLGKHLFN